MSELPTLRGPVVMLRRWQLDDAQDLHHAIQDPEIVRWLDLDLPYTLADARAFIAQAPGRWERREAAHFVVERSARFAGYLGVLAIEPEMRSVEIVYWTAAEHRLKGVASGALSLALDWLQAELTPDRIELGMAAGNEGSLRVATGNGFVPLRVERGAARLDGASVDEVILRWGEA